MTDDTRNLAAVEATPSGFAYVYVGEGRNRMCLTREPSQLGWLWSATTEWSGEISTGSFFRHWHSMMAYALERHALTPAEYKAAYEMREAK